MSTSLQTVYQTLQSGASPFGYVIFGTGLMGSCVSASDIGRVFGVVPGDKPGRPCAGVWFNLSSGLGRTSGLYVRSPETSAYRISVRWDRAVALHEALRRVMVAAVHPQACVERRLR